MRAKLRVAWRSGVGHNKNVVASVIALTVTISKRRRLIAVVAAVVCAVVAGGRYLTPVGSNNNKIIVKPIPVEIALAEYYEGAREITTTGTTQAEDVVAVKSLIAGVVAEVNFSIGSYVKHDDVLATLDTSAIDNDIGLKTEEYEMKRKLLEATQELLDDGVISYREYVKSNLEFLEIKQSLYALLSEKEKHFIVAPTDGVIESKLVAVGESIAPKDRIAILHSADKLKIVFHLDESEHLLLKEGSYAEVYIPAVNENLVLDNFKISKVIQDKNHSFSVELIIENKNEKIIPGLFANIKIILDEKVALFRVPSSALMLDGGQSYVFLVKDNVVHKQSVEIKDNNGGYLDVISGLQQGDQVVVSEKNKLADGVAVVIDDYVSAERK